MKKFNIRFSPYSVENLRDIEHFIASSSGYRARAKNYRNSVIEFCQSLEFFPYRGQSCDDITDGLRITVFQARITVAYTIEDNDVIIEGIYYSGQDWHSDFNLD
jgi:plasmid stabilization system protein ParE